MDRIHQFQVLQAFLAGRAWYLPAQNALRHVIHLGRKINCPPEFPFRVDGNATPVWKRGDR
jgi:hypothetical protein